MEKEFLTTTRRSVTLNVTGGKIDSFREQEETTGTVRVYEGGCIGVAGCLGAPDEEALTAKKSAEKFGLPNLGTASAAYGGMPSLGFNQFYADATAPTLGALAPGKAVYVVIASGGDMTPEGHYATPVQMAYLVENGKLVGRLPELNISGNFFELLGKDYLGTVHGTPQLKSTLSAVTMDVNMG